MCNIIFSVSPHSFLNCPHHPSSENNVVNVVNDVNVINVIKIVNELRYDRSEISERAVDAPIYSIRDTPLYMSASEIVN